MYHQCKKNIVRAVCALDLVGSALSSFFHVAGRRQPNHALINLRTQSHRPLCRNIVIGLSVQCCGGIQGDLQETCQSKTICNSRKGKEIGIRGFTFDYFSLTDLRTDACLVSTNMRLARHSSIISAESQQRKVWPCVEMLQKINPNS